MHGFAKRFLASQAVQHWLQKSDAWFPWITHLLGRRKGQTMCQTCPDHGPDMSDHGQTHHAWVSPWSVTTACVILVMQASGIVAGRHTQFDTSIACEKYCCKENGAYNFIFHPNHHVIGAPEGTTIQGFTDQADHSHDSSSGRSASASPPSHVNLPDVLPITVKAHAAPVTVSERDWGS